MSDNLFGYDREKHRRFRPTEPHALVPTPTACPDCGAATDDETVRTDALLRHGGYGATRRVTRRHCTSCSWSQLTDTGEERPPR